MIMISNIPFCAYDDCEQRLWEEPEAFLRHPGDRTLLNCQACGRDLTVELSLANATSEYTLLVFRTNTEAGPQVEIASIKADNKAQAQSKSKVREVFPIVR